MSQNNSNEKAAMLAKIETIHQVDGFDPTPFAVDYTDLGTGEVRKRLPVMIQMAWFRLKYPEGRIAVQVNPAKDCFVATAACIQTIRMRRTVIWQKRRHPEDIVRRNLQFHHGNGHRRLLLELLYEMQALDFSFPWQVKILSLLLWMNWESPPIRLKQYQQRNKR